MDKFIAILLLIVAFCLLPIGSLWLAERDCKVYGQLTKKEVTYTGQCYVRQGNAWVLQGEQR